MRGRGFAKIIITEYSINGIDEFFMFNLDS